MPKFILIDHSLRDTAGHYFEYAVNVLEAAERAGYDIVLATNQEFAPGRHPLPGWQVLPIYRYDFWGQSGRERSAFRSWRGLRRRAYRVWTRAWIRLRYSWIGYTVAMGRQVDLAAQARAPGIGWLIPLSMVAYVAAIVKALWRVLLSVLAPPPSTYVGSVLRSLWRLAGTVLSPLYFLYSRRHQFLDAASDARRVRTFASATATVLQRVRPSAEDIVFIPTLSDTDLVGLGRCLQDHAGSAGPTWHLLFRRNIYTGREADYPAQDAGLRGLRNRLAAFCDMLPSHRVYFYTDTAKLSDQWNRLHVARFETLPIPVDQGLRAGPNDAPGVVRLTYLGDARSEKGYQHLPFLVRGLQRNWPQSTTLRFTVQSNFMFQRPERQAQIVVARAELQAMGEVVEVLAHALDSDAYRSMVLSSDVGLLLYDRDQYYARSSGALVEYLTAGVPVLAPSGSWLSEQLVGPMYRYRASLRHEWPAVPMATRPSWRSTAGGDVRPVVDAEIAFGGETSRAFARLELPAGATYLLVSFDFTETARLAHPGSFVRIHAEWLDAAAKSVGQTIDVVSDSPAASPVTLMAIPQGAQQLWLGLRNEFSEFPITITDMRVDFLAVPTDIPTASVGLTYLSLDHASQALAEMVRHLDHYRRSAREFARQWSEIHNPDRLVRDMIARTDVEPVTLAVSAE